MSKSHRSVCEVDSDKFIDAAHNTYDAPWHTNGSVFRFTGALYTSFWVWVLFVHNGSIWVYISTTPRAWHAVVRRDGRVDTVVEPRTVCGVLNLDLCSRIARKLTPLGENREIGRVVVAASKSITGPLLIQWWLWNLIRMVAAGNEGTVEGKSRDARTFEE